MKSTHESSPEILRQQDTRTQCPDIDTFISCKICTHTHTHTRIVIHCEIQLSAICGDGITAISATTLSAFANCINNNSSRYCQLILAARDSTDYSAARY